MISAIPGRTTTSQHGASVHTYILVASLSAASMGLELVQTRVLSFLYYNHVVYLTVTVALLGFGISGVLVSLFSSHSRCPDKWIAWLTAAFVMAAPMCLALVSRVPENFRAAPTTIKLLLSYVGLTIPFLCSGGALGWTFMVRASAINRLYAVDLVCSSGAVLAFLLFLWPFGGSGFIWLCSGIALVGYLAFSSLTIDRWSRWIVASAWLLCFIMVNGHLLGRQPEAYKTLGRAFDPNVRSASIEATQWTPINRIDVWSDTVRDVVFGRPSDDATDVKMITQDADAFTMMFGPRHVATMLEKAGRGELLSALSLTYRLNPNPAEALVVGVGGGIDVVTARAHGARHITGVEINPATLALTRDRYRDFLRWPTWDSVETVRAEGRNYIRSKAGAYDTIVMSGVDTFAALNSGAYVLSENYLYTVEAFQDYLGGLKPRGTMAIYRWFFLNPRESLRLASVFQEAAERLLVAEPAKSIMVVAEDLGWQGYRWAATFVKKSPFSADEVRTVLAAVEGKPELSMIYLPPVLPVGEQAAAERTQATHDPPANLARAAYRRLFTSPAGPARQEFFQSYPFRIDPVYDDRPFFFEYFKLGVSPDNSVTFDIGLRSIRGPVAYYVLYLLLAVCAAICTGCIFLPLCLFHRRGLRTPGAVPLVLYFACLGTGYMLFEVGAMQVVNVYIGDPTYSLAIVLVGLLVSSGIGAALSARFANRQPVRIISVVTFTITAAILAWLGVTRVVQPLTMHWALSLRALIVLAALMPAGVLLGFPFPTAVKSLERSSPGFIAWAWGVNGVTSVLASIIAIVVAMRKGFTVVVFAAASTYLLALLSYRWYTSRSSSTGCRVSS